MDNQGWIKIYRKLENSSIFSSEKGLKIWIWCLLHAGHKENDIYLNLQKIHLQRGQFVFGRESASKQLGMSPSTVRNWIRLLKKDSYIDITATNKYSIITVLNYGQYQKEDIRKDNRITTEKQQNNTNNNDNNDNKVLPNGNTVKDQYGNKYINFILDEFKKNVGIYPIDTNARNIAHNIHQITNTFHKKYGELYKQKRGVEIKLSDIIKKAWEVYRKNNGDHLPQRIRTFKEHYKGMLEQLSISLQKE